MTQHAEAPASQPSPLDFVPTATLTPNPDRLRSLAVLLLRLVREDTQDRATVEVS
jgi:hypothetical protein